MKDSKGRPLYLYGVDIDSSQAYEAQKDLLETLKGITFVVKSHKGYGYHFYILTPVFHEIFPTITEDDVNGQNMTGLGTAYSSNIWKRNHNNNNAKANNIQNNESLDKYR